MPYIEVEFVLEETGVLIKKKSPHTSPVEKVYGILKRKLEHLKPIRPESLEAFTLPNIVQWIMYVPLTAGSRAIMIGVALGTIATCLKIILGIDRPYQGEGK